MNQQAEQQRLQLEHQSKMEQINAEGNWRMQIEQLRMQGLNIQEQEKSRARAYQTDKNADAKIVSSEISSNKEAAVEERIKDLIITMALMSLGLPSSRRTQRKER